MKFPRITIIAAVSFILNLIWENAQAPLYEGYISLTQHILPCLKATAGDVFLTLFIYAAMNLVTKDREWITHLDKRTISAAVLMGVGLGIIVEGWSLSTDRWSYNGMPIIPFLNVGILPVLQMAILPTITFVTNIWISTTQDG